MKTRINMVLVEISPGHPESYYVEIEEKPVGFLRLRHGHFRAEYREEVVYCAETKGDGTFDASERQTEIEAALRAIGLAHHKYMAYTRN